MIEMIGRYTEPDSERKNCCDCRYCQGAVTMWCVNPETCKARGTAIPGISNCPYWQAVRSYSDLSRSEKIINGDWLFI